MSFIYRQPPTPQQARKDIAVLSPPTAAPNTYTYAADGGVVFSGIGARIKEKSFYGSGGFVTSGTAPRLKEKSAGAIGGINFSGIGLRVLQKSFVPQGGVLLSGLADLIVEKSYTSAGGFVTGGFADLLKEKSYIPIGIFQTGGIAETIGPPSTKSYTGDGGLVLSGSGLIVKLKTFAPSGGFNTGGNGIYTKEKIYKPSGFLFEFSSTGITLSGTGVLQKTKIYIPVGGLQTGGAAATSSPQADEYIGTGGFVLGGAALSDFFTGAIFTLAPVGRNDIQVTNAWVQYQADFLAQSVHDGTSALLRPDALSLDYKTAYTLGPIAIGDTSAGLFIAIWKIRYSNNQFYISVGGLGSWIETSLFSFGGIVDEVDIAFDQNGRPAITWSSNGNIYLYWFDPTVSAFVTTLFNIGRTPRISLDNPADISNSDVNLFYINDPSNRIVYRQQRDRYGIEYVTPVTNVADLYLERARPTRNYRFELVFSHRFPIPGTYILEKLVSGLFPVPTEPESLSLFHTALSISNRELTIPLGMLEYLDLAHNIAFATNYPVVIPYSFSDHLDIDHSVVSAINRLSVIQDTMDVESFDIDHSFVSGELIPALVDTMEIESFDIDHTIVTATNAP